MRSDAVVTDRTQTVELKMMSCHWQWHCSSTWRVHLAVIFRLSNGPPRLTLTPQPNRRLYLHVCAMTCVITADLLSEVAGDRLLFPRFIIVLTIGLRRHRSHPRTTMNTGRWPPTPHTHTYDAQRRRWKAASWQGAHRVF